MRLSLVIPMRDEAPNVPRIAAEVPPALDAIPGLAAWEVVCVDDGSRDETLALLRGLGDPRFRIISLDRGYGQTAALAAGVRHAAYEIIGIIDADLQTDPADLKLLVQTLRSGFNCVNGARVNRRDSLMKRISTRVARQARALLLQDDLYDISCPLKVVEKRCLEHLTFFDTFHRFLPYLVRMQGFRVVEVPVSHRPRAAGRSHYGTLDRLFVGIGSILAVRWMGRNYTRFSVREQIPPAERADP